MRKDVRKQHRVYKKAQRLNRLIHKGQCPGIFATQNLYYYCTLLHFTAHYHTLLHITTHYDTSLYYRDNATQCYTFRHITTHYCTSLYYSDYAAAAIEATRVCFGYSQTSMFWIFSNVLYIVISNSKYARMRVCAYARMRVNHGTDF